MKKAGIICAAAIWALLFVFLLFRFLYNETMVSFDEKGSYVLSADTLLKGNWLQPYIAYHNKGNQAYRKKEYEEAVEAYNKALTKKIPEEKECDVRINLALAMLHTMGKDYAMPENIENSLQILYGARDVLLEKGCADEQGTGHSETAETLKKEIEEIIKQLEQQQEAGESGQEPDENDGQAGGGAQDEIEQGIEKALKDRQAQAGRERKENRQFYEDFDNNLHFGFGDKIW